MDDFWSIQHQLLSGTPQMAFGMSYSIGNGAIPTTMNRHINEKVEPEFTIRIIQSPSETAVVVPRGQAFSQPLPTRKRNEARTTSCQHSAILEVHFANTRVRDGLYIVRRKVWKLQPDQKWVDGDHALAQNQDTIISSQHTYKAGARKIGAERDIVVVGDTDFQEPGIFRIQYMLMNLSQNGDGSPWSRTLASATTKIIKVVISPVEVPFGPGQLTDMERDFDQNCGVKSMHRKKKPKAPRDKQGASATLNRAVKADKKGAIVAKQRSVTELAATAAAQATASFQPVARDSAGPKPLEAQTFAQPAMNPFGMNSSPYSLSIPASHQSISSGEMPNFPAMPVMQYNMGMDNTVFASPNNAADTAGMDQSQYTSSAVSTVSMYGMNESSDTSGYQDASLLDNTNSTGDNLYVDGEFTQESFTQHGFWNDFSVFDR